MHSRFPQLWIPELKEAPIMKTFSARNMSLNFLRTRSWTRIAADAEALAAQVSNKCGLAFEGRCGSTGPNPPIFLVPIGRSSAETFTLRITRNWRSLRVSFEQGATSGELIGEMGHADEAGRSAFAALLMASEAAGATIELTINGQRIDVNSRPPWEQRWNTFELVLRKESLPDGMDGNRPDTSPIAAWASRVGACIVVLLPRQAIEENSDVS
jgi:hypothetical protein